MKKTKIIYDPTLTISENAANNNLSVSSIRRYIRLNGIDRTGDNEIIKIRCIQEEIQKSPDISLAELSRRLGYSVNTIKKYLKPPQINQKMIVIVYQLLIGITGRLE